MHVPSLRARLAVSAAVALATAAAYGAGDYRWDAGDARGVPADASPYYGGSYATTMPLDEELLVRVSVWGEVTKAGFYEVPDGTDVAGLISYAGGPTAFANLARIRLTRPGQGPATGVDIGRYLQTGDAAAVPALAPGDTVYVPKNSRYAWTTFVQVMSQLAVVASATLLYVEVAKKD